MYQVPSKAFFSKSYASFKFAQGATLVGQGGSRGYRYGTGSLSLEFVKVQFHGLFFIKKLKPEVFGTMVKRDLGFGVDK